MESIDLVYYPVVISFISFIIGSNSLIVMIFFKNLRIRGNYSYWYTTLLAFFDLVFGCTTIPLQVLTTRDIILSSTLLCDVYVVITAFTSHFAILLLFSMSLDRYLRIKNLRVEDRRIRKRNTLITFFVILLLSLIASPVIILFPHEYEPPNNCINIQAPGSANGQRLTTTAVLIEMVTVAILPITVMSVINWRVFKILSKYTDAVRQEEKDEQQRQEQNSIIALTYGDGRVVTKTVTRSSTPTLQDLRKGLTIRSWIKTTNREIYFLKLVIVLQFVYFFTVFPSALSFIVTNHTSCEWCKESIIFRSLCPWAWFCNQAINPIVLFLSNKDFRRGFCYLFQKRKN